MNFSRRWWYLVAVTIAVVAWVVGTAISASAWDPLRQAEVELVGQPIQTNGQDLAVLTDLPQPDRNVTCTARSGKKRIVIPAAPVEVVVPSDGSRWHLIGVLDNPPSNARVTCRPADNATDTARYGTALVDLSSHTSAGKVVAWGGFLVGLGLAGIVVYTRTRRAFADD